MKNILAAAQSNKEFRNLAKDNIDSKRETYKASAEKNKPMIDEQKNITKAFTDEKTKLTDISTSLAEIPAAIELKTVKALEDSRKDKAEEKRAIIKMSLEEMVDKHIRASDDDMFSIYFNDALSCYQFNYYKLFDEKISKKAVKKGDSNLNYLKGDHFIYFDFNEDSTGEVRCKFEH